MPKVLCFDDIQFDRYILYENGLIKDVKKSRFLKPSGSKGFKQISLYKDDGSIRRYYLHRLVANAFVPNPNGFEHVRHIDGDTSNNHPDNLEWFKKVSKAVPIPDWLIRTS